MLKHDLQGPLELKMCERAVKFGLANHLNIKCTACGQENQCPTSERVNGSSGAFALNVKATVGMVRAGMRPAHVNSFLTSAVNLPTVHQCTLKNLERKYVGPSLESLAKQSCAKAATEEAELTLPAASAGASDSHDQASDRVQATCQGKDYVIDEDHEGFAVNATSTATSGPTGVADDITSDGEANASSISNDLSENNISDTSVDVDLTLQCQQKMEATVSRG